MFLVYPRCCLKAPELILRSSILMIFRWFWKVGPSFWGSRCRTEMAYIPFERASKTMGITDLNKIFHKLEPEISWIKGRSGARTGGPPPEPIWRHLVTWRRVLRTPSLYQRERSKLAQWGGPPVCGPDTPLTHDISDSSLWNILFRSVIQLFFDALSNGSY